MSSNNVLHKVLVLCQRKSGLLISKHDDKVEDKVVPKINDIVKKLVGDNYTIEYLSNTTNLEGEVDIEGILNYKKKLILNNENEKVITTEYFIKKNKGSYTFIILNTCPYVIMNYSIIYDLLSDDGFMICSSFPEDIENEKNPPIEQTIDMILNNENKKFALSTFHLKTSDEKSIVLFFEKIIRSSGGFRIKKTNYKTRARGKKSRRIKKSKSKSKSKNII
jgi:hypothetical protein